MPSPRLQQRTPVWCGHPSIIIFSDSATLTIYSYAARGPRETRLRRKSGAESTVRRLPGQGLISASRLAVYPHICSTLQHAGTGSGINGRPVRIGGSAVVVGHWRSAPEGPRWAGRMVPPSVVCGACAPRSCPVPSCCLTVCLSGGHCDSENDDGEVRVGESLPRRLVGDPTNRWRGSGGRSGMGF